MQMKISGHHLEITPALRTYVEGKFERLSRHYDHVNRVEVFLSVPTRIEQCAEARVEINQATIFANSSHEDMYAAIDDMVDKLDRQIKRKKELRRDAHKHVNGETEAFKKSLEDDEYTSH